jgi:hypothetical protein
MILACEYGAFLQRVLLLVRPEPAIGRWAKNMAPLPQSAGRNGLNIDAR